MCIINYTGSVFKANGKYGTFSIFLRLGISFAPLLDMLEPRLFFGNTYFKTAFGYL